MHADPSHAWWVQTLQVVDITQGTTVSFASGFQIADSAGIWNVPGGATLFAPNISVVGPLIMTALSSALDLPYRRVLILLCG